MNSKSAEIIERLTKELGEPKQLFERITVPTEEQVFHIVMLLYLKGFISRKEVYSIFAIKDGDN